MAEVYRTVRGEKIERVIARVADVQDELTREAALAGDRSKAILKAHRHQKHSRIYVRRSPTGIDRWIVLDDERGLRAAITIEFGRKGDRTDSIGRPVAPMEPVAPLRKGVGLL